MENVTLRPPQKKDRQAAEAFKQAFFAAGEAEISGSALWDKQSDYAAWLHRVRQNANPATASPDWVHADVLFAFCGQDKTPAGILELRYGFAKGFEDYGHIGYSVHPALRRQGIATKMLALALQRAKEQGMPRVLLTCLADNHPSRRTIIKNGGESLRVFPLGEQTAETFAISLV